MQMVTSLITCARLEVMQYVTGIPASARVRARFLPSKRGRLSATTTLNFLPAFFAASSVLTTTALFAYVKTTSPSLIRSLAESAMTRSATVKRSRMNVSIDFRMWVFAAGSAVDGSIVAMRFLSQRIELA